MPLPTSSGNAATKLQVSSTVRQAAGLLGLPLETLTGACRHSSHTFEGHGSHVPRIWWYRRMEDPAARPFRPRAVLGYVRLSPLAQSLSLEASLGRDLQAVQKQILADKASLAQLQAPHSFPPRPGHNEHRQSVKSSSARVVAGSEPRPTTKCWSSMNSPYKLTSFARPAALPTEQTWRVFVRTSHAQKHPLGVVGLLLVSHRPA